MTILTVDKCDRIVPVLKKCFSDYSPTQKTEIKYREFIKHFEITHDVKILGEISAWQLWTTQGIEFKSGEDAIAFKLRYGI